MNLQQMAQLACIDPRYLSFKSPRDQRVVEALGRVDRKAFLPEETYDRREVIPAFLHYELEGVVENLRRQGAGEQREFTQEEAKTLLAIGEGILTLSSEATVFSRDVAYDLWTPVIGYGQNCSDPGMVALMADLLELRPGMNVLEIGTGCGYHAAVTAELVGQEGTVYSVERILPLTELARANLKRHFGEDHGKERVVVVHGDGSGGLPGHGPYDRMYFTASVGLKGFNPAVFRDQLTENGTLLFPVDEGYLISTKKNGTGTLEESARYGPRVRFVPLREGVAE